jgi:hypothetical protein
MFRASLFPIVKQVKGEHEQLEMRSSQALRNMLAYCRARVLQLTDQHYLLNFQSRQQYDLLELLETCRRLQRVQQNVRSFSEKCLLIEVEMARRARFHR